MNSKELMYKILNGEKCDKIPVTPHWWGLYKFQFGGLISGYEGERDAWYLQGKDLAEYDFKFYEKFKPDMFHLTTGRHSKGNLYMTEEYKELKYKLSEMDSKEDIDKFVKFITETEDEVIQSGVFDHVKVISDKYGNDVFITLHEGNPVCRILDEYLGFEDGLISMMENPENVGYFLYKLYEALIPRMKALKKMGAHAYAGSETYCTQDIISPTMYRELVFPAQQYFYKELEKIGLTPITYFLGDVTPLIDDINKMGVKGLMVEESKKGFNLDVIDIRKKLSPEITLFGNLDSVNILQNGTVQQVREETLRQLKASEYGSFIMSNGCPISFNTPEENIAEMIKVVRNY